MKKLLALLLSTTILFAFTACSSDTEYGLQISVLAPSVSEDNAEDYASSLTVGDDLAVSVSTTSVTATTSSSSDQTVDEAASSLTNSTTILTITLELTSGEIDIIISDYDLGSQFANNDYFLAIDEVFTEDELSSIDSSLFVVYEEMDDDGNYTGETLTTTYGIDVSSVEELADIISADQVVCHVVATSENIDNAKEYILSILV